MYLCSTAKRLLTKNNMKKYQRIEPLLMKAWEKATKEKNNHAMSNLSAIALKRPNVPQHMKQWLSDYTA